MGARIDLTFEHDYEIDVLPELPGRAKDRTFYFPPGRKHGSIGLVVQVKPRGGDPWHGIVLADSDGLAAFVSSCPHPGELCLAAGTNGFVVDVSDPGGATPLPTSPITDVRPAPEDELLLLADETTVAALGRDGLVWRTGRLCWDGLRVRVVEKGVVRGEGWSPVEGRMIPFTVNLADGVSEGGARPEDYSSDETRG
jgi:hypothetical protein